MKFSTFALTAFLGLGLCSSYEDSLNAILNNQIDPNDGSTGDVSFKIDGSGLADYGVSDLSYKTLSSYNYLKSISDLASEAAAKGYQGDVVLLYYKFFYGGQFESTDINTNSDMVIDLSKMLKNSTKRNSLLNGLISASSSDAVKDVFTKASELKTDNVEKRENYSALVCATDNKANIGDCQALIEKVKDDDNWDQASSVSIHEGKCFISWSKLITVQYSSLYDAAVSCYYGCKDNNGVSCATRDVYLDGSKVNQCLSNKPTCNT